MLMRFEVSNYQGFKEKMVFDLSQTKSYANKKELIKNKISKHSIIYGRNASGKTALCMAIMDLTNHLLDTEKDNIPSHKYTYLGNESNVAEFTYVFLFDKKILTYRYLKNKNKELIKEQLFLNEVEVIKHDFVNEDENFIKLKSCKNLKTKGLPNRLSVLKYIYNNTIIEEESILNKLFNFIKGMLFFRSIGLINQYIGYKSGAENLDDIILRNNKLIEFQQFLHEMELNYILVPLRLSSGQIVIGAKYENGNVIPLTDISSSGTNILKLFFCWLLEFEKLTFLIIDEFDAYYHFRISEKVFEKIKEFDNLQSIVTTHNITLLDDDIIRPDCAYILDTDGVINLSNRYGKSIRQNNSIEKMYRKEKFVTKEN